LVDNLEVFYTAVKTTMAKEDIFGKVKEDIFQKVDILYPADRNMWDVKQAAEVRKLIDDKMKHGTEEEKLATMAAVEKVIFRAIKDATSDTIDVRMAANNYFKNISNEGTREEKVLAVEYLKNTIKREIEKNYIEINPDIILFAAEALVSLRDESAIETLENAKNVLNQHAAFNKDVKQLEQFIKKLSEATSMSIEEIIKQLDAGNKAGKTPKDENVPSGELRRQEDESNERNSKETKKQGSKINLEELDEFFNRKIEEKKRRRK